MYLLVHTIFLIALLQKRNARNFRTQSCQAFTPSSLSMVSLLRPGLQSLAVASGHRRQPFDSRLIFAGAATDSLT